MNRRALVGCAAVTLLVACAGTAYALSCWDGEEVLQLKLVKVTVDGVEQDVTATKAFLVGDYYEVRFGPDAEVGSPFTSFTECGAYTATVNIQPNPPAPGDPCEPEGLHCHWPEVGDLCAARCIDGGWQPTGCPTK